MKDTTILGAFLFVWFLSVLASIGITGVIIWAIVKFVNHYLT